MLRSALSYAKEAYNLLWASTLSWGNPCGTARDCLDRLDELEDRLQHHASSTHVSDALIDLHREAVHLRDVAHECVEAEFMQRFNR